MRALLTAVLVAWPALCAAAVARDLKGFEFRLTPGAPVWKAVPVITKEDGDEMIAGFRVVDSASPSRIIEEHRLPREEFVPVYWQTWMSVEDLDRDGYADLSILEDAGTSGVHHHVFRYDPRRGRFWGSVLLTSPTPDDAPRVVSSYTRYGASGSHEEFLRFRHDRREPVLLRSEEVTELEDRPFWTVRLTVREYDDAVEDEEGRIVCVIDATDGGAGPRELVQGRSTDCGAAYAWR